MNFRPNDKGGTTLDLQMRFSPTAGALGHAAAKWLGADPKKQMDEDLVRMKTFIEAGNPPHDAAKPS